MLDAFTNISLSDTYWENQIARLAGSFRRKQLEKVADAGVFQNIEPDPIDFESGADAGRLIALEDCIARGRKIIVVPYCLLRPRMVAFVKLSLSYGYSD